VILNQIPVLKTSFLDRYLVLFLIVCLYGNHAFVKLQNLQYSAVCNALEVLKISSCDQIGEAMTSFERCPINFAWHHIRISPPIIQWFYKSCANRTSYLLWRNSPTLRLSSVKKILPPVVQSACRERPYFAFTSFRTEIEAQFTLLHHVSMRTGNVSFKFHLLIF